MPAYRSRRYAKKKLYKKKRSLKGRGYRRSRAPYASRGFFNTGAELKYVDTAVGNGLFDTTGTVTALNLTAVGDDNTTRDGRQINNQSVQVQGIVRPSDGSTVPDYCRMMLVWDAQPNSGSIATITQILQSSTSNAMLNLDNRERFTIVKDWKCAVGGFNNTATQTYAQSPSVETIDWFVPLKGIKTTYSGTTAAIGSIATGALLLVTIGDAAVNDGNYFTGNCRVRFYG